MNKLAAIGVLCALPVIAVQACAPVADTQLFSLDAIQGAWWSDCDDPSAAFLVDGKDYIGDFLGRYQLGFTGDILVFKDGLVAGHSVDVTHEPLSFRIVKVTDSQLVLHPLPGNPYIDDWHLRSCN